MIIRNRWAFGALALALSACQTYPQAAAPSHPAPVAAKPGGSGKVGAMAQTDTMPLEAPVQVPNEWLVLLDEGMRPAAVAPALSALGYRTLGELLIADRYWLRLAAPAGRGDAAGAELRAIAGITSVDRHFQVEAQQAGGTPTSPNDPELAKQWSHIPTELAAAWAAVPPADQSDIIVAVVDSGMDISHPEFDGRVLGAKNFVSDRPEDDLTDGSSHGTHVAGIIGAAGDNGQGVAGVAWGIKLMPVRVLSDTGQGNDFDVLEGLTYALRHPGEGDARVRVINMSLGSTGDGLIGQAYGALFDEAVDRGILIVCAAGNSGVDKVATPGDTPNGMAVGATRDYLGHDYYDTYSQRGPEVALAAPGTDIRSTWTRHEIPEGYGNTGGTSMAAPFVAGVAALVAARYADEVPADDAPVEEKRAFFHAFYDHLTRSVDDLGPPGRDVYYGFGRINARKAVEPASLNGTATN